MIAGPAGTVPSPEVVVRVSPLGLRLWDVAVDAPAAPVCQVSCRVRSGRRLAAFRTPSGVYAFRGLPGLGAAERGSGERDFWYHPPVSGTFRLDVGDPTGQYLPMCLDVLVPARGLYRTDCRPPGVPDQVVPVFSAPSRIAPAGVAAVRAQLELASGGPAAWARLGVTLPDGTLATGVADAEGRVAVLFPWPEPAVPLRGRLADQTWPVGLRAWFGAATAGIAGPVAAPPDTPELCDLMQQLPARLLADDTTVPATEFTAALLTYGTDLVPRSAGRSTLLLSGTP